MSKDTSKIAVADTQDAQPKHRQDAIEIQAYGTVRLLAAHERIIEETRTAIEKTGRNGDAGSNDLLVSSVVRTNETQVWFVGAHLVQDAD